MGVNKQSRVTILKELINKERIRYGRSRLKWHQQLYWQCLDHTKAMARKNKPYHADPNTFYGNTICVECCAMVVNEKDIPRAIFNGWNNSNPHIEALLMEELTDHALAIVGGRNVAFATWRGFYVPYPEYRRPPIPWP